MKLISPRLVSAEITLQPKRLPGTCTTEGCPHLGDLEKEHRVPWADRKITTFQLARNWTLVYLANLAGAVGSALLVHWSGTLGLGEGAVGTSAIRIGETKAALGFGEAFFRGILCNTLVCLAVWLCFAAHDVAGKILAIVFPISAFVALGFEHSIANMYLIPIAMLAGAEITMAAFLGNLLPVTLGNVVGGGVFVAAIYWLVYLYPSR